VRQETLDDFHASMLAGGAAFAGSTIDHRFRNLSAWTIVVTSRLVGIAKQVTSQREVLLSRSIGQEAVVANLDETRRQDMQEQASKELDRVERHGIAGAAARVILLREMYLPVVH
jgi:hypothetical protein